MTEATFIPSLSLLANKHQMEEREEALQLFFSEVEERDPLGEPSLSDFLSFLGNEVVRTQA